MSTIPRPRRSRALAVGASALMLTATLAACSGQTSSGGATAATALNLGLIGSVNDQVFPYAAQSTAGESAIWLNSFDTLTAVDSTGKLQMSLAESFTPNANNTVWTVKLRPDVKLHNGGTFGADDVIYSVKKMFELKDSFGALSQISSFVDPSKIEKVDETTLKFTLKKPYGVFPSAWSYSQLPMIGADSTTDDPDGTGPFTVDSFAPNQQATLKKFDGYWGDKPGFDTLNIFFFGDQEAIVNALQGGQIDLSSSVPLANVDSLKSAGVTFLASDSTGHLELAMRTDVAPFVDVRVRRAMQLIIDREAVVKTAYNGYAKVGNDIDPGTGCPAPDVPQRTQDLAKAKQLLAEAGQSNLNVDLVTDGVFPGMTETAQLLSQDAAQIGVKVNVKKMDTGSLLDKWLKWPFVLNIVNDQYLNLVPEDYLPDGEDNAAHWNSPTFVGLADKLFATSDASEQCALVTQMQKAQYEDSPSIMPAYPTSLTPYSARVHGLHTDVFGRSAYEFAGVTVND